MFKDNKVDVRCGKKDSWIQGIVSGNWLFPFRFVMLMDRLTEEVSQEYPWTMNNIVLLYQESRIMWKRV